jgi:hypothetical protein
LAAGAPPESAATTELLGTVFDTGWESRGTFRQTLSVKPGEVGRRTWADVASRLTLRPGRYEVRVAATRGDRSGTVFLDLDVPDFDGLPLSLSGVTLVRGTTPPTDPLLAELTSSREFFRGDRVSAFFRMYERGSKVAAPVAVTSRIVSDQNQVVLDETTTVAATQFGDGRSADFSLPLPLARLTNGQYLLTIEATMTTRHIERHLTFRVLDGLSTAK